MRAAALGVGIAVVTAWGLATFSSPCPAHARPPEIPTQAGEPPDADDIAGGAPTTSPDNLLRGLDTDDTAALSAAIAAIERTSTTRELADVLFAAARAAEDRLHDPARALAIYERIGRDLPDAGVSIAATRRADQLRALRGHAREAADLAQLIADADTLRPADVERRARELAATPWPGALDAMLWLADWLCRIHRHHDAYEQYASLIARAPASAQAQLARRNVAGCAIEAKDWPRAERFARELPTADPIDAAVRADLLDAAQTGRRRGSLYTASWFGALLAAAALLASLAEAMRRGGLRLPAMRPPVEVLYIAPVAAITVVAAFIVDRAIAPAVLRISLAGIALSWISGAALDLLRARARPYRTRAVLHVGACVVAILAIGYIAITRDGLLDMLSETVRFGPGA
jgi:tetratricopeptide (TPR) repeat protein